MRVYTYDVPFFTNRAHVPFLLRIADVSLCARARACLPVRIRMHAPITIRRCEESAVSLVIYTLASRRGMTRATTGHVCRPAVDRRDTHARMHR